jgi:tetratricopeptide (TPR) repeat protein
VSLVRVPDTGSADERYDRPYGSGSVQISPQGVGVHRVTHMASIREYVNYRRHRVTLAQLSGAQAQEALLSAARRAFQDSDYERSLGYAFRYVLSRGNADSTLVLVYTRWLDMLSRNEEAIPILEQTLKSISDPRLANQLAWAIADVAPTARFGENAHWITLARRDKTNAVRIADTLGWMAYRTGDPETAFTHLFPLASAIGEFPDIGYHLAVVAHARGEREAAVAYVDRVLAMDYPFGAIYDAMRLQARLLHDLSSKLPKSDEIERAVPTIKRFATSESGLVVSLDSGEVMSLTWDRIWELADATDQQKQTCFVTDDRLGMVWPDPELALTTLHLREAALKGSTPPQYRPMYRQYPKSWLEKGIRIDTTRSDRDTSEPWR